ncbi:hypothetical protein BD289DRAFT_275284 [Coniella lustricola]|uniref:DUF1761-domain-containing protein n=1 Tax=Coniella lustricola TaxID=2025994 RepID=A0A2T3A6S1_9PEZI|nr:hypothetical protein BD289DRAFT_275284 [Coniella lustricola]
MSLHYLPPVKPSAVALGLVFNQTIETAVLAPLLGESYRAAKRSDSAEEYFKSREATSTGVALGTSFVGSLAQSYAVGALINATGTLSYKGATYLGGLIFLATSAPTYITQIFQEKRPIQTVGASVIAKVFETVGLAAFLTWWGTRTNPFE